MAAASTAGVKRFEGLRAAKPLALRAKVRERAGRCREPDSSAGPALQALTRAGASCKRVQV